MFLDANIFILAILSPKGKQGALCKKQLERMQLGEMNAHTSTLVLNEVLYYFEKNCSKEKALRVFNLILAFKNLEILPIDTKVLTHVPEFSNLRLEASDAYHAACMKTNGISTICSYDKGFDGIRGITRQEPK